MNYEKKFVSNYLSHRKYLNGQLFAFGVLTLCTILSLFYWNNNFEISQMLSASKSNIFQHQEYWRLFTTSLIHADIEHLLSNSLMLFILTYFVTSFYGFFFSTILPFLMGIIINYIVLLNYPAQSTLVGASGIVFYLWGFWLTIYLFVQNHLSVINRMLRIGAIFLILLIPTSYNPKISYLAHYIGLGLGSFIGIVYYLIYRSKLKSFEKWEFKEILEIDKQTILDEYNNDLTKTGLE